MQCLRRHVALNRGALALAVGLAVWAFAPLAAVGSHVAVHGGELIGTNGYDRFDQFQYLAWIRDEGLHLFGSDLWVVGGTSHDYVQPMYLISGLLWRAGVGIQVAYLKAGCARRAVRRVRHLRATDDQRPAAGRRSPRWRWRCSTRRRCWRSRIGRAIRPSPTG